jgi:hypothetical protein
MTRRQVAFNDDHGLIKLTREQRALSTNMLNMCEQFRKRQSCLRVELSNRNRCRERWSLSNQRQGSGKINLLGGPYLTRPPLQDDRNINGVTRVMWLCGALPTPVAPLDPVVPDSPLRFTRDSPLRRAWFFDEELAGPAELTNRRKSHSRHEIENEMSPMCFAAKMDA